LLMRWRTKRTSISHQRLTAVAPPPPPHPPPPHAALTPRVSQPGRAHSPAPPRHAGGTWILAINFFYRASKPFPPRPRGCICRGTSPDRTTLRVCPTRALATGGILPESHAHSQWSYTYPTWPGARGTTPGKHVGPTLSSHSTYQSVTTHACPRTANCAAVPRIIRLPAFRAPLH
jgi:hypothetical protein